MFQLHSVPIQGGKLSTLRENRFLISTKKTELYKKS